MTETAVAPNVDRLGGIGWTRRTRGALSGAERRRLLGAIVLGQGEYLASRLKLATGRVPAGAASVVAADIMPPDSQLAREAEVACAEQTPGLIGHGYRAWIFGRALAALDGEALDSEQFYVASLLHDHGLMHTVPGEDFTIRSAARAEECGHACGTPQRDLDAIGDAITVHATPGIKVETDGALGVYVQAGALVDLVGIRADQLTREFRTEALARYPRAGLANEITRLIAAEAKAVPKGRFDLLRRCGFSQLIRVAPLGPR